MYYGLLGNASSASILIRVFVILRLITTARNAVLWTGSSRFPLGLSCALAKQPRQNELIARGVCSLLTLHWILTFLILTLELPLGLFRKRRSISSVCCAYHKANVLCANKEGKSCKRTEKCRWSEARGFEKLSVMRLESFHVSIQTCQQALGVPQIKHKRGKQRDALEIREWS